MLKKYEPCAMCGKSDKPTHSQVKRSHLLFGAFPKMFVTYEHRCCNCERKLAKQIERMLKNV